MINLSIIEKIDKLSLLLGFGIIKIFFEGEKNQILRPRLHSFNQKHKGNGHVYIYKRLGKFFVLNEENTLN